MWRTPSNLIPASVRRGEKDKTPCLPTEKAELSTVTHSFSTTGVNLLSSGKKDILLVPRLKLDSVGELSDLVIDRAALSHKLADLTVGMHHRGVIAAAESLANFRK